jgi:hypothetical protein
MEVLLDAKEDQKTVLGLSYYSNALMQSQIMDVTVGYLLTKYLNASSSVTQASITMSDLEDYIMTLYNILRHEFIEKLKMRPIKDSI